MFFLFFRQRPPSRRPLAHHWQRRAFAFAGMILMLSACGSLPQPFRGTLRNDAILDTITVNPGVMIAPVIGAPPPFNQLLAKRIAAATRDRDVAAITRAAGKGESMMKGRTQAVTTAEGRTLLRFQWDLIGPDGVVIDSLSNEIEAFAPTAADPWLRYANTDLAPIVDEVAAFLAEKLNRPSALAALPSRPPDALTPDAPTEGASYHLHVKPVTGAPGDGRISLTRAMVSLFSQEGLPVALIVEDEPSAHSFIIDGRVQMSDIDEATQRIDLVWQVTLPDGQILGTIEQANAIPRGSLDGAWGDTAFLAAGAAAEGILSLLLQVDPLPGISSDAPPSQNAPEEESDRP